MTEEQVRIAKALLKRVFYRRVNETRPEDLEALCLASGVDWSKLTARITEVEAALKDLEENSDEEEPSDV